MKKILALLADFANGIFATILAGLITGVNPTWHFFVGIVLAMLPDLDAIPELLKRGAVAASKDNPRDHREALHFPIIFIITGVLLIMVTPFWGWLFLLATVLHFINDLYGTGWGIPIFWPITKRRFKFLSRRANLQKSILIEKGLWSQLKEEERRLRLVVSWAPTELNEYITRYGIEDWIEKYYLRFNLVSLTEYVLFIIAIIILVMELI